MTEELDVQMYPLGVAIILTEEVIDENLPGQINLSWEDADTLRHLLNETWLNKHGLEKVSIPFSEVTVGDALPGMGTLVVEVTERRAIGGGSLVKGYFANGGHIELPNNVEVTVHRRIQ